MVRLLVECGADINHKDKYNVTGLEIAAQGGYDKGTVIRFLLSNGAECGTSDEQVRKEVQSQRKWMKPGRKLGLLSPTEHRAAPSSSHESSSTYSSGE